MTKKTQNFKRFISAFLVLVLALSFLPELSVKAEESIIDLVGDSVPATTSTFRNGISYCQTGYLCYLLTEDGNAVPGTSAKLFKCAGFNSLGRQIIRCTSRKGGYSADHWDDVAPWEVSPFNSDRTTNAEAIRAWATDASTGMSNGNKFVSDTWGNECMQKFVDGDYILVMETVLHFQYTLKFTYKRSVPLTGWKMYYWAKLKEGNPSIPYAAADGPARYYYNQAQAGTEYKALFGSPFVGTVRDCLNYFNEAKADAESTHPFISVADTNYFSLYLNQVACFAERIGSGSAGERAGFIPYTGSLDRKLTNAEVMNYGVGMLVISSKDDDIDPDPPTDTGSDDTPTSDYDGTVYTLTATGGSSSSGSGSSATTYFGNGSGSCLSGSLYAENCASGTDAYKSITKEKL